MGKAAVSSFLANEQRTAQQPEPANPDGYLVTHTCPREILNWWGRIGQTWKEQVSGGGSSCFIFLASAGQGVTGGRGMAAPLLGCRTLPGLSGSTGLGRGCHKTLGYSTGPAGPGPGMGKDLTPSPPQCSLACHKQQLAPSFRCPLCCHPLPSLFQYGTLRGVTR